MSAKWSLSLRFMNNFFANDFVFELGLINVNKTDRHMLCYASRVKTRSL